MSATQQSIGLSSQPINLTGIKNPVLAVWQYQDLELTKIMKRIIELDGHSLTIDEQCVLIARGYDDEQGVHQYPEVRLSADAQGRMNKFNAALNGRIAAGDIIYGVNTGCGIKKSTVIPNEEIRNYQAFYIPAHCVAAGEPFDEEIVRLAMVLRVNSFAKGNSAMRVELCQQILDCYNKGVIPYVKDPIF